MIAGDLSVMIFVKAPQFKFIYFNVCKSNHMELADMQQFLLVGFLSNANLLRAQDCPIFEGTMSVGRV